MKTIVVFNEETNEILAVMPLENGKDGIIKNGISYEIYDNEPIFEEVDDKIYLSKNKFVVNLNKGE